MLVRVKHVHRIRIKGRLYYYHRRTRERLPDDPVQRAKRILEIEGPQPSTARPGTLDALIVHFRTSPEYAALSPASTRAYGRYLDWLGAQFGKTLTRDADREAVLRVRNMLQGTSRTADYTVAVLSRLFKFALDYPRLYGLEVNPAARIGRLAKPEGYKPWPDNLIAEMRKRAPDAVRRAMEMALWTGQREGDCVAMLWSHYDGQTINVVQGKTKARLTIPVAPELKRELDAIKKDGRQAVILTTTKGRPWKATHLRHQIAKWIGECGFAGYSFHGLRYNAAKALAEGLCTEREIAAITGHRTLAMVAKYTRAAEQEGLARSAMRKRTKRGQSVKLSPIVKLRPRDAS